MFQGKIILSTPEELKIVLIDAFAAVVRTMPSPNNVTSLPETSSKFLNAKKAGELFGVHPNTIRNWYKAGYFKKYVIEGVSLYDVEQIETFIKSQALEPA